MKKYLIVLFVFLVLDIVLLACLDQPADQIVFLKIYSIIIFMEIPLYGTFILYEIRKKKEDDEKW